MWREIWGERCGLQAWGTTGGEETDGFLASVEKPSPLALPMRPVVGASPTGAPAERDGDGDLPKVTLPDPAVCVDWFRAPGGSGMSGATQSPKAQLFPD